jgi:hypothetical protein
MKKILIPFIFFLSFKTFGSITILSDLDDTIKITQGRGRPTDFLGDDVYTGMPEFFKESRKYAGSLYILSASPSLLQNKIKSTLQKKKINYQGLILRKNVSEDKFSYKVRAIKKIMNSSTDDFIFLGDDLGKDPEVYTEISRLYPGRVLGVYIHIVNGRPLKGELIPYWTSFDLFLREFESYRMSSLAVEKIIDTLMKDKNPHLIFPKKAQCPTSSNVWEWQMRTIFMSEAQALIKKFIGFCQLR